MQVAIFFNKKLHYYITKPLFQVEGNASVFSISEDKNAETYGEFQLPA